MFQAEVLRPWLKGTKTVGLMVKEKGGKGQYCGTHRWIEELDCILSSKRKPMYSLKQ